MNLIHIHFYFIISVSVCWNTFIYLRIYKSYTVSLCYVSFTKPELYFPEFTCMYVSGLGLEKFAWDVEDGEDAQPFILCFEIWCRMPVTFNPWMLSANCWFTLVVRSAASGPAASPECPGLFASASLGGHVHCSMSKALASPADHCVPEVVRETCRL